VSPPGNGMCQAGTTTAKNTARTPTMWALLWILTVSSLLRGDGSAVVLKGGRGGTGGIERALLSQTSGGRKNGGAAGGDGAGPGMARQAGGRLRGTSNQLHGRHLYADSRQRLKFPRRPFGVGRSSALSILDSVTKQHRLVENSRPVLGGRRDVGVSPFREDGAPERIRTSDPQIRRRTGQTGSRDTPPNVKGYPSLQSRVGPSSRTPSGPAVARKAASTGRTQDCTRPTVRTSNRRLQRGSHPHRTLDR
jgi:hypothetical protein